MEKTRRERCRFYQQNGCKKGDSCTFIHQKRNKNASEQNEWLKGPPNLRKTRWCWFDSHGGCKRRDKCNFRHKNDDKNWNLTMSNKRICKHWLRGSCTYQNCKFLHVAMEERRKYDTPCKYYLRGYCKKGDSCQFRHNSDDRKNRRRPPSAKFKTVHCTFYLGGYCKKQDNCTYIHDPIKLREMEDKRKLPNTKENESKTGNEQRMLMARQTKG